MLKNLQVFRVQNYLTQEQMAEKLGYERSTYAAVENGKQKPSLRFKRSLAAAFNLDDSKVTELLTLDEI